MVKFGKTSCLSLWIRIHSHRHAASASVPCTPHISAYTQTSLYSCPVPYAHVHGATMVGSKPVLRLIAWHAGALALVLACHVCAASGGEAAGSDCSSEYTPLSTAIPCPKTWADGTFLVPHEAIRMLSQQLLDAVNGAGFDPAQHAWQGPMLHEWYRDYYFGVIHHHHDVEERIFFPFMDQHLQSLGLERPPLAHTSHEHLLRVMDDFLRAAEDLAQHATPDGTSRIQELAKTLAHDMNAHLEEEERLFPPVLAEHFTEEQDKAITDVIIQDLGLLGNKVRGPWLARC